MQVIATKSTRENLHRRAPATLAGHIKSSKVSVFSTAEITLVLFSLHRGNLDGRSDMANIPNYSEDMKQLAIALLNLAKTFMPQRRKPVTPTKSLNWTKFDKPVDQMTADERRAAAEQLAKEALENLNKKR